MPGGTETQVQSLLRDRGAAGVAGVLLAWSAIPLALLALHIARHGGVWSGSEGALAGSDQQLYLAWIRESGSDILISNEFRIGDSKGVFLHPMFLVSGLLWQLGVPLKLALLLWKPIAAAVLGAGIWLYTGRFLEARERIAAAALAAFYFSPVLPLLVWGGAGLDGLDRFYLTLVSGESMAALQLWGYLHAALVIGVMAFFVLGVERLLAPGRASRRVLAGTSAIGLVLAWMHPWQGAILLAVMAGVAVWGRLDLRYWILAVPGAAMLAPMVYELLLSKLDADWKVDAAQNAGTHAPLWIVAAGLAPLVVPADARAVGGRVTRGLLRGDAVPVPRAPGAVDPLRGAGGAGLAARAAADRGVGCGDRPGDAAGNGLPGRHVPRLARLRRRALRTGGR